MNDSKFLAPAVHPPSHDHLAADKDAACLTADIHHESAGSKRITNHYALGQDLSSLTQLFFDHDDYVSDKWETFYRDVRSGIFQFVSHENPFIFSKSECRTVVHSNCGIIFAAGFDDYQDESTPLASAYR